MSKRNIGLYALIGLVGAAGVGLGYTVFKKKKPARAEKITAPEELPDTPPAVIECPDCGNRFKEYELYCPYCRKPAPRAAIAED